MNKLNKILLGAGVAIVCLSGIAAVSTEGLLAGGVLTLLILLAFAVSVTPAAQAECLGLGSYCKVTRAFNGNSRSCKITFVAFQGQLVVEDPASMTAQVGVFDPAVKWKLANGEKGVALLERDVIVAPLPLDYFFFENKYFLTPDIMRDLGGGSYEGYSTGRTVQEVEFEGVNYIDGSITTGTAAKTPLSTKAGKLSTVGAATSPAEVVATLVSQLTPLEAGNVRILVQFHNQ